MEISSSELQEKIKNGEKIVVDFWAGWCGPCRMMKPIFERVSNDAVQNNSEVSYYTFDVESDKAYAASLGIRSIPTIKSFANGREMTTQTGVLQEEQLKNLENILVNG
jgi:thioredoxin 2